MISEPIICAHPQEILRLRPSCCLTVTISITISILIGSNYNNHLQHVQQSHNTLVVERSKCLKILH